MLQKQLKQIRQFFSLESQGRKKEIEQTRRDAIERVINTFLRQFKEYAYEVTNEDGSLDNSSDRNIHKNFFFKLGFNEKSPNLKHDSIEVTLKKKFLPEVKLVIPGERRDAYKKSLKGRGKHPFARATESEGGKIAVPIENSRILEEIVKTFREELNGSVIEK